MTSRAKGSPRKSPPKATVIGQSTIKWSLADGLGLTLLTCIVWWSPWPWLLNSLHSLVILTVGAFACAPFGVRRWMAGARPSGLQWIPIGAAAGLLAWGVVSAIFSGAPWAVSLSGWEGRNDGLLALVAVALLALCASSLTDREIQRLVSWLLVAGAILVVQGLLQLAGADIFGTSELEGVWAALGNPNFYAAMCGILAALALAKALDPRLSRGGRVASGALYVGLAAGAYFSMSVQGPAAFVIATFTVLVLRAIQLPGKRRIYVALGAAVAVSVGVGLTVLGLVGVGPMTWLWDSPSTGFRKIFWDQAISMANAMPIFGTGPDGLARHIGEFRTEDSVRIFGFGDYLSAAHNVPLQYAATLGWIGSVLWLTLVVAALLLLVRAAWAVTAQGPWIVAAIGGALAAYAAQSLVSIDALDLKAVGWTMIGLCLAVSRQTGSAEGEAPSQRPGITAGMSGIAALMGLVIFVPILTPIRAATTVTIATEAAVIATNPALPCRNRLALIEQLALSTSPEYAAGVAATAAALDERCPGILSEAGRTAVMASQTDLAVQWAQQATELDPWLARGWLVLANARLASGDKAGAESAIAQAEAVDSAFSDPALATAIAVFRQEIASGS